MGDDDAKARNADLAGLDEPETYSGDVQSAGPAICRQCVHAIATYRWWKFWMCDKALLPRTMNYVTGEADTMNQYGYCRYKNPDGRCEDYEEAEGPPRPTGRSQYEPHRE